MITGTKVDKLVFKAVCDYCEENGFEDVQFEEAEYRRSVTGRDLDDADFRNRARDKFKWDLYQKRWSLHQDSQYLRCPRCQCYNFLEDVAPSHIAFMLMKLPIKKQMDMQDFLTGHIPTMWNQIRKSPS